MKIKNPKHNSTGGIDCEIEHHLLGWIPFTATPDDTEIMGREIYAAAVAGDYGEIAPYTISDEALRADLHRQIQRWRDQQENGGVDHMGHRWDTDQAARDRIQSALLAGSNPLGYWTSADNVNVAMDIAGLQQLWSVVVQRGAAIHARQREMKDEIAALSGVALLDYQIK
ncbi:DUF4376 domain-containing protein [Chitinibacter sp. GC72]|uniref:DUF4376 domain-containing protein n=1 Tax=Chitinibacter sp. GC72 TaxID=1526917 RepID=UPI0012F83A3B|nr:DUF4376 domain-containing protein [Chitinibacter sp. GC72]